MNILNIISVVATFAVSQVIMYCVFNFVFCKVEVFNKQITSQFQIKHILYFTISTLLLLKFTTFHLPY